MPAEYSHITEYWDKLTFRTYSDYTNQPYIIIKKLEWYKQAEQEGQARKEAKSKK